MTSPIGEQIGVYLSAIRDGTVLFTISLATLVVFHSVGIDMPGWYDIGTVGLVVLVFAGSLFHRRCEVTS